MPSTQGFTQAHATLGAWLGVEVKPSATTLLTPQPSEHETDHDRHNISTRQAGTEGTHSEGSAEPPVSAKKSPRCRKLPTLPLQS